MSTKFIHFEHRPRGQRSTAGKSEVTEREYLLRAVQNVGKEWRLLELQGEKAIEKAAEMLKQPEIYRGRVGFEVMNALERLRQQIFALIGGEKRAPPPQQPVQPVIRSASPPLPPSALVPTSERTSVKGAVAEPAPSIVVPSSLALPSGAGTSDDLQTAEPVSDPIPLEQPARDPVRTIDDQATSPSKKKWWEWSYDEKLAFLRSVGDRSPETTIKHMCDQLGIPTYAYHNWRGTKWAREALHLRDQKQKREGTERARIAEASISVPSQEQSPDESLLDAEIHKLQRTLDDYQKRIWEGTLRASAYAVPMVRGLCLYFEDELKQQLSAFTSDTGVSEMCASRGDSVDESIPAAERALDNVPTSSPLSPQERFRANVVLLTGCASDAEPPALTRALCGVFAKPGRAIAQDLGRKQSGVSIGECKKAAYWAMIHAAREFVPPVDGQEPKVSFDQLLKQRATIAVEQRIARGKAQDSQPTWKGG